MSAEKKNKNPEGKSERSFEQSLKELETIVSDLEKGELPLEESIQKYQSGIERLKECHEILGKAQKRIEILTKDAKGALSVKPMNERSAEQEG